MAGRGFHHRPYSHNRVSTLLSCPRRFLILSFVKKTSWSCQFEKYPMRESDVLNTQYALLFFKNLINSNLVLKQSQF